MENEELENKQPTDGVKDANEELDELSSVGEEEGIEMPKSPEEMENY